ncbi:MAG: hypothetical protein ACLFSQ_05615 [Candidatus Zixiibacteriota bacterium]
MLIDAPWFIKSDTVQIPVEFLIRDANISSLDELEGIYIEIPDSRSGYDFSNTDTIFSKIYDPVIEDISSAVWDTIVYIDLPEAYTSGDTFYMKCTFDIEDGLPWDEKYSQVLAVKIGYSAMPRFRDWYLGDCHFHTSITDNPYEDGGRFPMIQAASRAIGIDFVMATDHASDSSTLAGVVIDDMNQSDWENILDSIYIYGSGNPLIIRGEEADIENFTDSRNHFLIYGNNNFFSAPIPETEPIRTHLDLFTFLDENPEAIGYAAHPYSPDFFWEDSVIDSGIQMGVLKGLQIWNEKKIWDKDVDTDFSCNPFPFSDGVMWGEDGLWDSALLTGLEKWDYFLVNSLISSADGHPYKLFISGGSDAHGDFNYFTYHPFVYGLPSTDIRANSNAFAKIRTLAYSPDSLNEESILQSLRNGRSIATDGPVIDMIAFNPLSIGSRFTFLGETDTIYYGEDDSLRIRYKNTIDFGGRIRRITLKKLYADIDSAESIELDSFITGLEGSFNIPVNPPIDEGWCCYRLEAYTFYEGQQYINPSSAYRCFTNPIWFYIQSEPFQISESEMPDIKLELLPNPFRDHLEIKGQFKQIDIYDILGKRLFSKHFNDGDNFLKWSPTDDASSLFLIVAKSAKGFVKKRALMIR